MPVSTPEGKTPSSSWLDSPPVRPDTRSLPRRQHRTPGRRMTRSGAGRAMLNADTKKDGDLAGGDTPTGTSDTKTTTACDATKTTTACDATTKPKTSDASRKSDTNDHLYKKVLQRATRETAQDDHEVIGKAVGSGNDIDTVSPVNHTASPRLNLLQDSPSQHVNDARLFGANTSASRDPTLETQDHAIFPTTHTHRDSASQSLDTNAIFPTTHTHRDSTSQSLDTSAIFSTSHTHRDSTSQSLDPIHDAATSPTTTLRQLRDEKALLTADLAATRAQLAAATHAQRRLQNRCWDAHVALQDRADAAHATDAKLERACRALQRAQDDLAQQRALVDTLRRTEQTLRDQQAHLVSEQEGEVVALRREAAAARQEALDLQGFVDRYAYQLSVYEKQAEARPRGPHPATRAPETDAGRDAVRQGHTLDTLATALAQAQASADAQRDALDARHEALSAERDELRRLLAEAREALEQRAREEALASPTPPRRSPCFGRGVGRRWGEEAVGGAGGSPVSDAPATCGEAHVPVTGREAETSMQEATQGVFQDASQDITLDTTQDASQDITQDTTQDATRDKIQDTIQDTIQDVIQDANKEVHGTNTANLRKETGGKSLPNLPVACGEGRVGASKRPFSKSLPDLPMTGSKGSALTTTLMTGIPSTSEIPASMEANGHLKHTARPRVKSSIEAYRREVVGAVDRQDTCDTLALRRSKSSHLIMTATGGDPTVKDKSHEPYHRPVLDPFMYGKRPMTTMTPQDSSETTEDMRHVYPRQGSSITPQPPQASIMSESALVASVTHMMAGAWMYKYPRKLAGKLRQRGDLDYKRLHKRYFWINPFTMTIFWSENDPLHTRRTKSALIGSVETRYKTLPKSKSAMRALSRLPCDSIRTMGDMTRDTTDETANPVGPDISDLLDAGGDAAEADVGAGLDISELLQTDTIRTTQRGKSITNEVLMIVIHGKRHRGKEALCLIPTNKFDQDCWLKGLRLLMERMEHPTERGKNPMKWSLVEMASSSISPA